MSEAVRLESLTVEHRRAVACRDVSLTVAPGSVYALLGHPGAGKTSVVEVLLGRQKPSSGRALIFGLDSWRKRRALARRVGTSILPGGIAPELLVLDDPAPGLVLLSDPQGTVILATGHPDSVAGVATHVGILKAGRLVLDGAIPELTRRFRRIRYANQLTETRTAFGTELDAFDAVRVRVRGWGIDAVVSNFDDAAFENFRQTDGVEEAQALPMTISEIFLAVAGEGPPPAGFPTP